MSDDKQEKTPKTPDALTKTFLSEVLGKEYGQSVQVESFRVRDADAGVLSHVVMIDVDYTSVTKDVHKKFVAKFLLPLFPLEHMFRVESHFYRTVAAKETLSFQTPRPIYTSSSLIMVEHIRSDQSYTAVQGCPKDLVVPLITRLGRLHSKYLGVESLDETCRDLSAPAGVGSTLSGLAKETQFAGLWDEFLTKIPDLDETVRSQIRSICQKLSTRRLSDIHTTIHEHSIQTLIHGDFHVANMLFWQDDVWLVDWATCGKGFPLIDLAFFAIVSLTTTVRKQVEEDMLKAYHQALDSTQLSVEDCRKFYRLCILNQFLILVGYDKLSREIVQQTKRPEELTHHFNVVNARACHALINAFGEDLLPREKTAEEAAMAPQGEATL